MSLGLQLDNISIVFYSNERFSIILSTSVKLDIDKEIQNNKAISVCYDL